MNHCSLINGLIGLQTTAVPPDIVALTMKIGERLSGWVCSGVEEVGEGRRKGSVWGVSLGISGRFCGSSFCLLIGLF